MNGWNWPRLRQLNLLNNPLDKLGARTLAQSKLPLLSTLKIGSAFDVDIMSELVQASWPLLQNLIAKYINL